VSEVNRVPAGMSNFFSPGKSLPPPSNRKAVVASGYGWIGVMTPGEQPD
jgi:hypothetical protein